MAFTVTARQSGNSGETAAQTLTTSSATPTADSLFLVCSAAQNNNHQIAPTFEDPSGGGLSYTQVATIGEVPWDGSASFALSAAIERATVGGSPSGFTVTVDHWSNSQTAYYGAVCLDITGHDATTPIVQSKTAGTTKGSGNSESGSVTLDTTPSTGSLVVVAFAAGADGGGGFATPELGGQSMTAVTNQDASFTQVGVFSRVVDGTESDATITCNDLGQTVGNFTAIAIEIAAAAGGGTAVAQATETDTAQAVGSAKAKAADQASETDLAQPVASAKTKTLGQAAETDTAQNITAEATIVVQLGQAVETDTAQAIMAPAEATSYDIHVDWNQDGDFDDTGEDVTSRVLAKRSPITIQYGRDQARSLAPLQPGVANMETNNVSGDYSPDNAASPLFGSLGPGREVRIRGDHLSTTYGLYRGYIDKYQVRPNNADQSVALSMVDALGRLRGVTISTPVHHSIRTGEAIGLVLDAVDWPTDKRDLDAGASYIRWWWEEGDAFTALQRIIDTEGPPSIVTVSPDGDVVFRDRHHRITDSVSLTSQATFRGTGTEPLHSEPTSVDYGWSHIINSVPFDISERDPASTAQVVWSSEQSHSIADGETIAVRATGNAPFIDAITPVAGTDFTIRSGAIGSVSISRDSGASSTIQITATGGAAVIDSLQLRAVPLTVRRMVRVLVEDSVSIDEFGRRTYDPPSTPWLNANDAAAVADVILAHRAQRRPTVTITVRNGNDTRWTQQFARDLSDRITVVANGAHIDDEFHIEQIRHTISEAGMAHETAFSCEQVVGQIASVFTFDVEDRGFDDGKFGLGGLDDPDNVFRFDTADQGFNDGHFAH